MSSPDPGLERRKISARIEKHRRLSLLGAIPTACTAIADLATGWLGHEWRLDLALLLIAAMIVWSALSSRRLTRRLIAGPAPVEVTPMRVMRALLPFATVLAITAGLGYLLGGTLGAILFPSWTLSTTVVVVAVAVGIRRRRRRAARSESVPGA